VEEVRGMHDFTPLRNKGKLGHAILSTIATATPALLEDQIKFEQFISTVEAFIVAEDQLAEAAQAVPTMGQFPGFFGFDPPSGGMPNLPSFPNGALGGGAGSPGG